MPKLLIAQSHAHKKDRKAETSIVNMKKLIEKRVEKDGEDKTYTLVTLNTKMKLKNVVMLINASMKKLAEHEDVISVETMTIDPEKKKGRWTLEDASPKKSKKKDKE